MDISRTTQLLALMKQGDDAFNRRDFAGLEAVHHPDITAHLPGSDQPVRGRVAHTALMRQMFETFPDIHVDNDPYPIQFGNGDWITVITRARGTFSRPMTLPDGQVIAATGRSFDLNFSTSARWEDDLLAEEFVLWDSALQAQQLGLT